jgi:hypothetical protein
MPLRLLAIALGLSAILASTTAIAAPPKLKGLYVEHGTTDCGSSGKSYVAATARFAPASASVHFVGYSASPGSPTSAFDDIAPYSNNATTVTIEAGVVYQAIYGPLDTENVPQFFELVRSDSVCAEQLWFQKKS